MDVAIGRCSVRIILCALVLALWAEPASSWVAVDRAQTDGAVVPCSTIHDGVNVRVVVRAPGSLARVAADHADALAPAPDAYTRALLRGSSSLRAFALSTRQATERLHAVKALTFQASRRAESIARIGRAIQSMGGRIRAESVIGPSLTARVPRRMLSRLSRLADVLSVQPVIASHALDI